VVSRQETDASKLDSMQHKSGTAQIWRDSGHQRVHLVSLHSNNGVVRVEVKRGGHFLLSYQSPFLEGSMNMIWQSSQKRILDLLAVVLSF